MPRVDDEKLSGDRLGEKSETIRARVEAARERFATLHLAEAINIDPGNKREEGFSGRASLYNQLQKLSDEKLK